MAQEGRNRQAEEETGVFELMMTLAEGHPQYKPESDGQPRDKFFVSH